MSRRLETFRIIEHNLTYAICIRGTQCALDEKGKKKKSIETTYLFLLGNHFEWLSNYPILILIKRKENISLTVEKCNLLAHQTMNTYLTA